MFSTLVFDVLVLLFLPRVSTNVNEVRRSLILITLKKTLINFHRYTSGNFQLNLSHIVLFLECAQFANTQWEREDFWRALPKGWYVRWPQLYCFFASFLFYIWVTKGGVIIWISIQPKHYTGSKLQYSVEISKDAELSFFFTEWRQSFSSLICPN